MDACFIVTAMVMAMAVKTMMVDSCVQKVYELGRLRYGLWLTPMKAMEG